MSNPTPFISDTHHDIYPFVDPTSNPAIAKSLKGKTVLITGAGTGIGKSMTEYFALAGVATVIITGRRESKLDETKASVAKLAPECEVIATACDVASEESVQKLFEGLRKVPDVLVNNAGTSAPFSLMKDQAVDKFWGMFEINVKGVFLCSRAYINALNGQPGTIVNTSSEASNMTMPYNAGYCTTKTTLNRLAEHLDAEYSSSGLRVFTYHPGAVLSTEMGAKAPDEFRAYFIDKVELSAGTAVWLASEGHDFLSGRYVSCTWDMEELLGKEKEITEKGLLKTRIMMY